MRRQQATIVEKVAYFPMYEICAEAERMLGTSGMVIWWDQDMVN